MNNFSPYYILRSFTSPFLTWEAKTKEKNLYLTFDDGPTPGITDNILNILETYNAKATFFCIGEMVKNHPRLYASILDAGHSTGNHTFSHLNGWKTGTKKYLSDINEASVLINSKLFRPPFGKITPAQVLKLRKHYKIVMWSLLSNDFDENISKEIDIDNLINHSTPGSIIVFHDSEKAYKKCIYTLPRLIEHFNKKGFVFKKM